MPKGTTYFDKTIRIDKNPIKTALNVCKHLISKRVYAVVVSHDEKDSSGHDLSPAAVSYTSGFYQIPVIGISSRDAAFSDKNIHVSFLRTVPPYYHQADVWLEMLSHFGYTKVCGKLLLCLLHVLRCERAVSLPIIGNYFYVYSSPLLSLLSVPQRSLFYPTTDKY